MSRVEAQAVGIHIGGDLNVRAKQKVLLVYGDLPLYASVMFDDATKRTRSRPPQSSEHRNELKI